MAALTNKQKQAALRLRRAALGQKEVRGIWVTESEETFVKKQIRAMLKKMRAS